MQNQQQSIVLEASAIEFRAGVTACLRSWSALRTAVESGWGGSAAISQDKAETLRQHIYESFPQTGQPVTQSMSNRDPMELADQLAIYLEEEFSVTLEDRSEEQVANTIFQLYDLCVCRNDFAMARNLVEIAENAKALAVEYPVQVQTTEHDDDDDDDSDMDDGDDDGEDSSPMENGGPESLTNAQTNTGDEMDVAMDLVKIDPTPVAVSSVPSVMPSASEYIAVPLFGPAKPKKTVPVKPVRQLGEGPPVQPPPVEVDDDGFAPIVKKGRRRNN